MPCFPVGLLCAWPIWKSAILRNCAAQKRGPITSRKLCAVASWHVHDTLCLPVNPTQNSKRDAIIGVLVVEGYCMTKKPQIFSVAFWSWDRLYVEVDSIQAGKTLTFQKFPPAKEALKQ